MSKKKKRAKKAKDVVGMRKDPGPFDRWYASDETPPPDDTCLFAGWEMPNRWVYAVAFNETEEDARGWLVINHLGEIVPAPFQADETNPKIPNVRTPHAWAIIRQPWTNMKGKGQG